MYIGDNDNSRVRKVTVATTIISTFAGTGSAGYSGDNGVATSAALNFLRGVAVDSSGIMVTYYSQLFLTYLLVKATCTSLTPTTVVSAR